LSVHVLVRDEVQFGFGLDAEVNAHLQRAASLVTSRAESLQALLAAKQASPEQLEVLVALYKFYFYQSDLEKAEQTVQQALACAARQGGFAVHWQELAEDASDWSDPRGPGRAYLYALKALAFIRLRQDRPAEARQVLDALQHLDPDDRVGADVIRDLQNGLQQEDEDGY